jgi:UDP-2-acetamido-2-deoxy-ribo-hexuluronate aminotransferase
MTTAFAQAKIREVPFFSCARAFERQWPRLKERLHEVVANERYNQGVMVEQLENEIQAYTSARYAIAVGNGTDALALLLKAAGIGPGDEVIVPCFTFVASATSIVHAGATPVFVDIDPITYTLDVEQVSARITERTRAIMPVHLFAQMADMALLQEIAQKANLQIIEDSAEAIGMRYAETHAGLLGTGGVLSFFPTKTLGALGDAGMVLTNDPQIAERVTVLRSPVFDDEIYGGASRMDEIQAAVLLTRLAELDLDIAKRAKLALHYDVRLAELYPQVRTPAIVKRPANTTAVYYVYVIETERKKELISYLAAYGVGTEEYYPMPLHRQACFAHLEHRSGDFPNAESACLRTVALPLYPDMTEDDVDYVCDVITSFHKGTRS